MLKNNSGITMITLVITIIVLLILTSITTYSGISSIESAKYYNAISQLKVLQSKVNELYEDYKNGNTEVLENGESILEYEMETKATQAYNSVRDNNLNDTNIGILSDYRYYSSDYIRSNLDLEGINYNFLVNIKERSVILFDGVTLKGFNYYALCQIEGEQYNVKYESENTI